VFIGYSYACLEALRAARESGCCALVDQIDPAETEAGLVGEERLRWPDWERNPGCAPQEYWDRVRAEWETAHLIIVNSEWSKEALRAQGVPDHKLVVVPLAYEGRALAEQPRWRPCGRTLNVLYLGSVILRKGIQYLIECARMLQDEPVEIVVAGPIRISTAAVRSAPPNVRFLGHIPRSVVPSLYRSCDVFALPTISDGFAITQLEAMACGLPVLVTPNCARVVTDGSDGLVVEPRSAAAFAEAIMLLVRNRDIVRQMSVEALRTVRRYSVDAYADGLTTAIARAMECAA